MMKFLVLFISFLLIFSVPVYGSSYTEVSGAEKIEEGLPEEVKELLQEEGISISSTGDELFTGSQFFSLIEKFLTKGIKGGLSFFLSVLAILVITSLLNSYSSSDNSFAERVSVFCCAVCLSAPLYSLIEASREALEAMNAFFTGAIPVFAGIMASSGRPLSAASASGIILVACQVFSYICTYIFTPLMSGYLALSLASSFGEEKAVGGIMSLIKSFTMWGYSLLGSVFIFLLTAKGELSSNSDKLSMKTAKFILGTTVPVAGSFLSESASGVAASIEVLKGTSGIYIMIGIGAIMVPLLIDLVLKKIGLTLLVSLSDAFSCPKISKICASFGSMISILLGYCLISFALMIISMGVLINL